MGTNYYHRTNICECCDRYDETHICKSLTSFEAVIVWGGENDCERIVTVGSWQQWKYRILEGGQVWDEYGKMIPVATFVADVESVDPERRRWQYDWCVRNQGLSGLRIPIVDCPTPDGEWLDADGFSFSGREFS